MKALFLLAIVAAAGLGPTSAVAAPAAGPAWRFLKLAEGRLRIEDSPTGLALTTEDGGSRVALAPWTGAAAQQRQVAKAPDKLTL